MPIPITSLDDRKFEDLVIEARERLQHHLPEMTQLSEGDPLHALVDLFAWMTESVIYRANLIPERQRQAFLNLLQLPLRPATPARGIVSIDAKPGGARLLPPLLGSESTLVAGDVTFSTVGELQPAPLAMAVMIKEKIEEAELRALDISAESLREIYNTKVNAFRPRTFIPGQDTLRLNHSLDNSFYLLVYLPDKKQLSRADAMRSALAGTVLNFGLAPQDELTAEKAEALPPRQLKWDIAWQRNDQEKRATYLPLEVVADSSNGGRQTGVARLRLPRSETVLKSSFASDPQYAGFDNTPPEPPVGVDAEQVLFWLRLSAPQENDFNLGYLGINAVDVIGQGVVRDQMVAIGNGRPEQAYVLPDSDIDAASLQLEVSEHGAFVGWQQVTHFAASEADARVYRFDAASGVVQFGDGVRGKRPAAKSRVRAAYYRYGGGKKGNMAAESIKQLASSSSKLIVRHEWATQGGLDAETVSQAEQRIPAHLMHRNRAVTKEDFALLARDNPINPVGRAEVVPGLLPGSSLDTVQPDIPGVISLFVLPPMAPRMGAAPRPTAGLLRDLYHYIDARKLLGTELYVLSPEFVPLAIALSIEVLDPTVVTEIQNGVNSALLNYLWALSPGGPAGSGWPLGRDIKPDELKAVAARVSGVLSVGPMRLYYQARSDRRWHRSECLALQSFQLPEVMEVVVEHSVDEPAMPGIVRPERGDDSGETAVAVPVIPDIC